MYLCEMCDWCDWCNKEQNNQSLGRRDRWDFWGERKEGEEMTRGAGETPEDMDRKREVQEERKVKKN